MSDFDHILNWKLLRGSHKFPGLEGGTCINEAAVVACGFPYQSIVSVAAMPACFSRPICQLALRLNDEATDVQRQRLMPFVTRLACADTPEVEQERTRYIEARISTSHLCWGNFEFDTALKVLEGALAIGRQADPLGMDEVANRLAAARGTTSSAKKRTDFLPTKVKGWLGLPQALEDVG
jgi:hypothetical protein